MRTLFRNLLVGTLLLSLACSSNNSEFEFVDGSDGHDYHAMLVSGNSSDLIDIVIMGDGYRDCDQDEFNAKVDQLVRELLMLEPFVSYSCGLNIWRLNVVSEEYGIDDPAGMQSSETALGCKFGSGSDPSMYITGDVAACLRACDDAQVPHDVMYVLVPDPNAHDGAWTDMANHISYASDYYAWGTVMAHELGHSIVALETTSSGLGDEYTCWLCDGTMETQTYPGGTPPEPNLTDLTDRTRIPWADQIATSTALPTTGANDVIGAWEGGGHYPKGIYRPASTCVMNSPIQHYPAGYDPFCKVCRAHLEEIFADRCQRAEEDDD